VKCYNGVSVRLRIPLLTLRNTNNGAAGGNDSVRSVGGGERSGGARS
jgi:hypothetical protein